MSTQNPSKQTHYDADLLEKPVVKRPPRFGVWMLNDDYTPMAFVVDVLQRVFHLSLTESTQIMWTVHTEGRAKCGVYSRDIALTKTKAVARLASEAGHPLRCDIQVEDEFEN